MMQRRATRTKQKVEGRNKKSAGPFPKYRVMEGGGIHVGGLERPGMYQPSPLRKGTKISKCARSITQVAKMNVYIDQTHS